MTTPFAQDAAREEDLVVQAVDYALGVLPIVAAVDLGRSTPCRGWDLGMLLSHLADSVSAVEEGLAAGRIRLARPPRIPAADAVAGIRTGLASLLRLLPEPTTVTIGRCSLAGRQLLAVAAVEVAVHAWDISVSCGSPRRVPSPLADRLLELGPALVDGSGRAGRFGPPVPVAPGAPPGDRLVAFLGRRPQALAG